MELDSASQYVKGLPPSCGLARRGFPHPTPVLCVFIILLWPREHAAFPTIEPWIWQGLAGAATFLTPAVLQHGLALVGELMAEAGHPHGAMNHL